MAARYWAEWRGYVLKAEWRDVWRIYALGDLADDWQEVGMGERLDRATRVAQRRMKKWPGPTS